jgi:hypothetical protein
MGSRGSELAGYPGCASLAIEGRVNSNLRLPISNPSSSRVSDRKSAIGNEKSI